MKEHPIKAIRRAGVPLVAFETQDPAATLSATCKALNGKQDETPLASWDFIQGLQPLNDAGRQTWGGIEPVRTTNPAECLSELVKTPVENGLVFIRNAQAIIKDPTVSQAVWNLRDIWKACGTCLVLLAPQITLPPELAGDIVVITEALPDKGELREIVNGICENAGIETEETEKDSMAEILLGSLSAFSAETTLALSVLPNDGKPIIDKGGLWERKRRQIEQTPGLAVWRGKQGFDSLGGLANLKGFLRRLLTSGVSTIRAIGFIDEIEKLFAGSAGDLSGVSQDALRCFLSYMQDKEIPGIILVGPPGTGKSAIAKSAGAESGAEVISLDTGAMTGSLVGESQAKVRTALDVFTAVSAGKGLFIATCNKLSTLPPELRRRFSLGTFFLDLPTAEEQAAIWPIWQGKYGLPEQPLPDCVEWTGAEIRACCDVAWRTGMTLREAASFVVPVCKSAADSIADLRRQASGRFISASEPGLYQYRAGNVATATVTRKIGA